MATEHVTMTWCDECLLADGSRVPGEPWSVTLTVPGGRPRTYDTDVCERHGKPLVELAAHLAEHARGNSSAKPSRRSVAATDRSWSCPVPGCPYVGPTRDALGKHTRAHHDTSIAELNGEAVGAFSCPDCVMVFQTPQGRGAHRTAAHGYVSPVRKPEAGAGAGAVTRPRIASRSLSACSGVSLGAAATSAWASSRLRARVVSSMRAV